jgi:hypothetical protein
MSDECNELKTIKYKSMLLKNNNDEKEELKENVKNMEDFLLNENTTKFSEPWNKLNKTYKLLKINEYVDKFAKEKKYNDKQKEDLLGFLTMNIDRKRLLKSKEVIYDKDKQEIINIPGLTLNNTTKKFTLKRVDKKPSTMKSLAPKKNKKKKEKIDLNNKDN